MEIIKLTEPEAGQEPLQLQEAKQHLRIDTTDDNRYIQSLINAARDYAEHYCNRPFAPARYALQLDDFPAQIALPFGVSAVTAITYLDSDDTEQTLPAQDYTVSLVRRRITPATSWPAGSDVRVEYAVAPGTVSPAVIAALKIIVAELYENREDSVIGVSYTPIKTVQCLLNQSRVFPGAM